MVKELSTSLRKFNVSHYFHIPKYLLSDDRFPFQKGDDLTMRIDGQRVVIEREK